AYKTPVPNPKLAAQAPEEGLEKLRALSFTNPTKHLHAVHHHGIPNHIENGTTRTRLRFKRTKNEPAQTRSDQRPSAPRARLQSHSHRAITQTPTITAAPKRLLDGKHLRVRQRTLIRLTTIHPTANDAPLRIKNQRRHGHIRGGGGSGMLKSHAHEGVGL